MLRDRAPDHRGILLDPLAFLSGYPSPYGGGPRTFPMVAYKESQTQRTADLILEDTGRAAGPVTLTFTGEPALIWRQRSLASDDVELHHVLEHDVRDLLPTGADVTLDSIDNLQDYEKPLVAHFTVKAQVATVTARRAIVPGQLFQVNEQPLFPDEKRESAVYFHYPERVADGVRFHMPPSWQIKSPPAENAFKFKDMAFYKSHSQLSGTTITLHRDYVLASVIAFPKEYAQLREFYSKVAVHDQEPLVVELGTAAP